MISFPYRPTMLASGFVLIVIFAGLPEGQLTAQDRTAADAQDMQARSAKVQWMNFSEGMKQAKTSNKRILIDICAQWCPWCKQMDAKVYGDREVVDYIAQRYIAVRLNGEGKDTTEYEGFQIRESDLADKLGTKGYPTSVFLAPTGEFMVKLDGYINKEVFLKVLQYIGEDVFEKKSFTEFAGMSLPQSGGGSSSSRGQHHEYAPGKDSLQVQQ